MEVTPSIFRQPTYVKSPEGTAYLKVGRESYHYHAPDSAVRLGERQIHTRHIQIHHKKKRIEILNSNPSLIKCYPIDFYAYISSKASQNNPAAFSKISGVCACETNPTS